MPTILAGAQVSPSGDPGSRGTPALTTTAAIFTVPNVGINLDVPMVDASWMTIGQLIYVANAGGPANAGALQVTSLAGNVVTITTPATGTLGQAVPGTSVPFGSLASPGGAQGPQGSQGVQGPPGPQGVPGNAAPVAAGPTTTLAPGSSATVTNTGST